jgi:hypothetical protein
VDPSRRRHDAHEWFERADGTLAIGEIAQRPPGANISLMTVPAIGATKADGYVVIRHESTE